MTELADTVSPSEPRPVIAPPVDGRANGALCRLIAKRAGVSVRSVSIVRGASAREKVVRVAGINEEDLRRALG